MAGLIDSDEDESPANLPRDDDVEIYQPDAQELNPDPHSDNHDDQYPPPPGISESYVPDMRKAVQMSGADFRRAMANADSITGREPETLNIPSERCGGESRRAALKRKASDISRSACEAFAYCSSRTTSIEDSSMLLSAIGNVSPHWFTISKSVQVHKIHKT